MTGLLAPGDSYAVSCKADRVDAETLITHVHDGDTVFLDGRRKIRIIGLDTPELAQENKPAEPLAREARDYLRKLLAPSDQVKLRFDMQQQDRYQRDLAHLFLANGDNIAVHILDAGLATALIIPPNLQYADCYLAAQDRARTLKRGIWRLPEFQPIALADLDPATIPAYRFVTATVASTQRGRRDNQIRLQDGQQQLTLFIRGYDRALFSQAFGSQLVGQTVLVQGWINKRHGRLQMVLRHPGFITVLAGK